MAGYSFSVTVYLPNSPCTTTQSSVAVGHQGEKGSVRRRAQATAVITRISTPTVIAR